MPISQNTALFSLVGTFYGGDGKSTFALPNLMGRAPMHHGQGPGLTARDIGETGGQSAVPLTVAEIPAHTHGPLRVHDTPATTGTPSSTRSLARASKNIYGGATNLVAMGDSVGGSQPHDNRQPYLGLTFIIALQGVFPPRG
jgi:microcystin-dependent protein